MTCACGNSARYIDTRGVMTCGICPIKAGLDSIKISDVPKLLAWARRYLSFLQGMSAHPPTRAELRDIIGRLPG